MTEFMRIVPTGIKCDAPGCGYRDDTADLSTPREWLDKPCPLCGASLLTQADLDLMERMKANAAELNALLSETLPPELVAQVDADPEWDEAGAKLEMHGDGSLTIHLPAPLTDGDG